MKHYEYKTQGGVCSTALSFDIDDEQKLHNVRFRGGCLGNLKAIGKLVEGQNAESIMNLLKGNTCRTETSCADQLAIAIGQALNKPSL